MGITMQKAAGTLRFSDHPPGLFYLFFAETWERFSYYGLRALLILYMTSELLFNDSKAYGIYATYTALVYTTPIIGGLIADRLLGNRRAIIIGGILIALGHMTLALPGNIGFFMGLSFIISGTGLFKANISSLLGQLYKHGDPHRDAGFTLFYVGINIGGFIAPLACGYVGVQWGWDYGFGLAAIGMLLGLATFLRGLPTLENKGMMAADSPARNALVGGFTWEHVVYLLAFISVPLFSLMVQNHAAFDYLLPIVGVLIVGYMLYLSMKGTAIERKNVQTILILMFFYMMFFSLFEQAGSSLNLFADRVVDRVFMGWEIPTPWFQSLNPLFIITLGPVFAIMWAKLGERNLEPYTPMKFFFGLLQAALGFGALAIGVSTANENGTVCMLWLVLAFFFHSTGELCLSPIGLSMVTKLAPEKQLSTLMGILFLSIAYGNYLAGALSKLASIETEVTATSATATYASAFTTVTFIGFAAAVVMLIIAPLLKSTFAREEHMDDRK